MHEPKKRGRPKGTPKTGGRKKGSEGRRLHITIPREVADVLPEGDREAREVIIEKLRQ